MAKVQKIKSGKRRGWTMTTYNSFAKADQAEREYWWSRTPAQRMRALEELRQLNYGYGKGKPLPRFERILRVAELGGG